MGIKDAQFTSFRRQQLRSFEHLMKTLLDNKVSEEAIQELQIMIDDAKKDIEK